LVNPLQEFTTQDLKQSLEQGVSTPCLDHTEEQDKKLSSVLTTNVVSTPCLDHTEKQGAKAALLLV
jgi:hypothetical protein